MMNDDVANLHFLLKILKIFDATIFLCLLGGWKFKALYAYKNVPFIQVNSNNTYPRNIDVSFTLYLFAL